MFKENDSFLVLGTDVGDLFCLFNPRGKTLRDKVLAALRAKMEADQRYFIFCVGYENTKRC